MKLGQKWMKIRAKIVSDDRHPPLEEPGGGPGGFFRSPTDCTPTLPRYNSRVGGNHHTVGHVSEEVREDGLLMP